MWSLENYIIYKLLFLMVGLIIVLDCISSMVLSHFFRFLFQSTWSFFESVMAWKNWTFELEIFATVEQTEFGAWNSYNLFHWWSLSRLCKQHQNPFPKFKALHATKPLELVHSDLIPFSTHSFSKAKYALTFIHNFSCRSWVYFHKYKDEFFATLKSFKYFVQK